jgi:hypothetical protein
MFVPPSWVLKNICTWLNMNVSPLVVKDKVIRACLNYLSPAYYKFYRREELLQLFSKDFTDVRSNEMHVVRDKWFKRYLVGVGLQIKGVQVDKNYSTNCFLLEPISIMSDLQSFLIPFLLSARIP